MDQLSLEDTFSDEDCWDVYSGGPTESSILYTESSVDVNQLSPLPPPFCFSCSGLGLGLSEVLKNC